MCLSFCFSIILEFFRWLLSRGWEQEVEDILCYVVKVNNKELFEKFFDYEDLFEND